MCETCGCTVTRTGVEDAATVEVLGRLLQANDRVAAHNRDHFNSTLEQTRPICRCRRER
jgi:hypothetical protein